MSENDACGTIGGITQMLEIDSFEGSARRLISMNSTFSPGGDTAGYVRGLAEMYVADERFAANYGGVEGACFVRDALTAAHYDGSK